MSITTSEMTPADIRACTCGNDGYNNGGGMFGNDWAWIIILLLFGYGRNGFGGGVGGGSGIGENYVLATDFATIERKLDGVNNGLCDGFYAQNTNMLNGFAGVQQTLCQGFSGVNSAISNLGYQQAQCCCDIKGGIKDVAYGNERNSWMLSKQISDCCCDIEKMNMQNRFDAQAFNCNTLQAIDKLGDRIIDYMASEKTQALRDENMALRLAASQEKQNNFIAANQEAQTAELIRRLGLDRQTCPIPAYVVPNPNCCYGNPYGVGYNNNGCGCGNNGGF
ncbi:MAG: hypothetical protein J6S71_02975 [Clostridia bacterium]|nr:hypothetical protein [Clostridia bacterium]